MSQIVTKSFIKKASKDLGIPRVSKESYGHIQTLAETYLNYVLKESYEFTRHRKASTLTIDDITAAMKRTT